MTSIKNVMRRLILAEIREENLYSLQVDTTTDMYQMDQCSVVIRYLYNENIYEKVIGILSCTDLTGLCMFNMITNFLERMNNNVRKYVGNCIDGSSNMCGAYNGFTKWLSENSPRQIRVWCYS
ncbi:uncharacterized protein TNCT_377931 [Trichonephila clavata]|uniref:DUF4371 domain-containing protein n=1 Tax=Trichonephila clavata TaxID=2740835 RepID=A0A8X6G9D7_TRICU|nr:uncharacterized protein TNCT_377931 [Trichonephila clavata]